ncbi:MAG: fibronectin type III domain-containing protein [Actinomycetota bacterium]|nr:fibronectin type III domain-containing protein [Actinomycetota bacterium]
MAENGSPPGSIGRISTAGAITIYSDTSIDDPTGITVGPDGALWFTNVAFYYPTASIGRITTAGTVTTYADPSISDPQGITTGPDGALWFTNRGNSSIGRITTAPGAPRSGSAVPEDGAAKVTWQAPTSNGGSAITGYVISAYIGYVQVAQMTFNATATSEVVNGLTNGTTYRFKVAAINAVGTGPQSTASGAVVVGAPVAPTGVNATPGNGQATVRWIAPANNGFAITGYVVRAYLFGTAQPAVTFNSSATRETLTGLTNAKSYTFAVAARNANGIGPQSSSSLAITVGAPTAPTNVTGTPGTGSATVAWTPPSSSNGSAITGYVITAYIGYVQVAQVTFNSTATSQVFNGLTNGMTYRFKVAVRNANGTGVQSVASNAVTPT